MMSALRTALGGKSGLDMLTSSSSAHDRPQGDIGSNEIPQRNSLLPHQGVLSFHHGRQARLAAIQHDPDLLEGPADPIEAIQ